MPEARPSEAGPPARIFLSYARGDDEAFVRRLHDDLTKQGFDVWFDRVSMPSRNLTFHQEIRDAIAARDRLVLVVGPKAGVSDYVRQEWQFAWREADKVVTPILRLGDYPLVPDELKLIHAWALASTRPQAPGLVHHNIWGLPTENPGGPPGDQNRIREARADRGGSTRSTTARRHPSWPSNFFSAFRSAFFFRSVAISCTISSLALSPSLSRIAWRDLTSPGCSRINSLIDSGCSRMYSSMDWSARGVSSAIIAGLVDAGA